MLVSFSPTSLAAAAAGGGVGGGLFAGILGKVVHALRSEHPQLSRRRLAGARAFEGRQHHLAPAPPHHGQQQGHHLRPRAAGDRLPDAVAGRAHHRHGDAVGAQQLRAPAGGSEHRADAAPQRVGRHPPRDQRQHRGSRRRQLVAGRTDDQPAQDPDGGGGARRRDHRPWRAHQGDRHAGGRQDPLPQATSRCSVASSRRAPRSASSRSCSSS